MLQSGPFTIRKTQRFERWLRTLRDTSARTQVLARLGRLGHGHLGDSRTVGAGVWELRIHAGPGYRVYFARIRTAVIFLLAGGDKSTQERDIVKAKALAAAIQKGEHDENSPSWHHAF